MPPDFLNEIDQYTVLQTCPKPGRCALLVIDMQQYFLSIATPILGNVLSIIEACRSKGIRIIFTRDYRVFFVSDATATVNDELHVASLKNLAFGFAHIVSTEQLCRYLSKGDYR